MDSKQRKILGHKKQESILAKALISKKLFPVWIFYGPNGIGKLSIALKFAKYLLIDEIPFKSNLDLNENHNIHKLLDNLIHPDFFLLDTINISIDDIRILIGKIYKTPIISKRRVIIINNLENLNKSIYNSLLKILEEPPKNTIFILICNNIGMIPVTLLSRSYKLRFFPLTPIEIETILKMYGNEDNKTLAKISNGSVSNALFLKDNDGVQLYNSIINVLNQDYKSSNQLVAKIIENNFYENFNIVKQLIIQAFYFYIINITGIEKVNIFQNKKINSIKHEIGKVLYIISLLNSGDSFMLDKKAIIAEAFELFFERSSYESRY